MVDERHQRRELVGGVALSCFQDRYHSLPHEQRVKDFRQRLCSLSSVPLRRGARNAEQRVPNFARTRGQVDREESVAVPLNRRRFVKMLPNNGIEQDSLGHSREVIDFVLRLNIGIQLEDVFTGQPGEAVLIRLESIRKFRFDDDRVCPRSG